VIYIASTPEKVFAALTSAEQSEQFWSGFAVTSDWRVGSDFCLRRKGKGVDTARCWSTIGAQTLLFVPSGAQRRREREAVARDLHARRGQWAVRLTLLHDDFEEAARCTR